MWWGGWGRDRVLLRPVGSDLWPGGRKFIRGRSTVKMSLNCVRGQGETSIWKKNIARLR